LETTVNKLKYLATAMLAIAGFAFQQARADTYTFNLSIGNPGISGLQGPYAQVSITLTSSTTATVTFTSLTNSGNTYLMGDGGSVALNVNATSFTASSISGTNSGGGTPGPYTPHYGPQRVDGFGRFNFTITSFDGFAHSSDSITFTLTNTSGTWASALNVLIANNQGAFAASHIFVAKRFKGKYVNLGNTGFAANGGCSNNVPDAGGTVVLLGAVLGALGMARRYLKT